MLAILLVLSFVRQHGLQKSRTRLSVIPGANVLVIRYRMWDGVGMLTFYFGSTFF